MEPITLILTALVAGAAETSTDAVKDAYQGIKELIKRRFTDKPEATMALAKHAEKPQVWEEPLKDEIITAGLDRDEEILTAAKQLLELAQPEEAAGGKYNVQFHGEVKGAVIGDQSTVNQTFN